MQQSLCRHSRGAVRRGCVWGLLPASAPGAAGGARASRARGPRGRAACLAVLWHVQQSLCRHSRGAVRRGCVWGLLPASAPGPLGGPGLAGSRALAAELHALLSCGICSSPCAVTPEVRFGGAACGGCCRPRRPGPLGGPGPRGPSRPSCMPCCLVAYVAVLVPSLPRCGSAGLRVGVAAGLGAWGRWGAVVVNLHFWLSCLLVSIYRREITGEVCWCGLLPPLGFRLRSWQLRRTSSKIL